MTTNEMLQSRSISHAHYLERYKTQVVKRILEILKPSERNIVERLQTVDPDTFTEARLRRLLEDVRTINAEAVAELNIGLTDELKEFGAYESDWQSRQIQAAVPIEVNITQPSPDQIFAAVESRPFAGMLLADQVAQYGDSRVRQIEQAVRQGWIEGETIQSISRRVRGSRASNYTDGIISTTRKHAESLVRTAVNHTHTVARQSLYDNNRDLVKGVQYVATLDNRTTMICASLDGSIHPIDSGPRPPQHFGCRSTTVPVVKSWREMGIDLDEAPEGTRASMNGQVPAKTTYSDWLKKQPAAVQREVLGESRYKMFRDGTPIDKFVADGRVLTLDQLKAKDAA